MRRRRIKKHSRTSLDVQFKHFSFTKQKTRPRTDYERIGKPFLKNLKKLRSRKLKKKQNNNVKMPHANKKPLAKIEICIKQKSRPKMNYEWFGYTNSKKNLIQKIEKQ